MARRTRAQKTRRALERGGGPEFAGESGDCGGEETSIDWFAIFTFYLAEKNNASCFFLRAESSRTIRKKPREAALTRRAKTRYTSR